MKQMTDYQRELVIQHMGVVDIVIRKRIIVNGRILLTYEDLYQIGCEALCRAAMDYKPENGSFGTLAYRCIYNALVDHCKKQNNQAGLKHDYYVASDEDRYAMDYFAVTYDLESDMHYKDIGEALQICKDKYTGIVRKGIEALELKSLGYNTPEIAQLYGTTVNNLNAWISRARKRLQADEDFLEVVG